MNTSEIKSRLVSFLKNERGADMIATEVDFMDICVLFDEKRDSKTREITVPAHIVEIEVKITKADFLKDFNKQKHKDYWRFRERETDFGVPNKFYYAVPNELKDFVCDYLKDHETENCLARYGVFSFSEYGSPFVARRAKLFHEKLSRLLMWCLIRRVQTEYMAMELCYREVTKDQKRHRNIFNAVKQHIQTVLSCHRCGFYERWGWCKLLFKSIKTPDKSNCIYLFKEEEALDVPVQDNLRRLPLEL